MRKRNTHGDTPTTQPGDQLRLEVINHPFKFREFIDQVEVTTLIVETINRMGGAGESAENDYQRCLAQLAEYKQSLRIIQTEYFDMPEDSYLDRWGLVMLAVELVEPESVDFFSAILEEKIPKERSKDPHSFTTVGEETMIRTTAIEGLERLAVNGDEKAVEILLQNIIHESFSVRRAAVQALLATGNDETLERLKESLPEEYHNLLDIRRTSVQEVEQAEGGLFLKPQDDDELPMPNEPGSDKPS